ncbi:MAG: GNAT family acetyltransferase [Oscillospiraceae bacterium]|nr:GNAT family acetyltransferase [Oscillospiraceae bacterium]
MKNNIIPAMDMVKMVGEDSIKEILSDFSCEYSEGLQNNEVEQFLQNNAIDFSRRKMSITYLVLDNKSRVAGYFTLTHKPIIIPAVALKSKTGIRKMQRYAKYDEVLDAYSVSAFLIAQFSKNYNIPSDERISGTDLMKDALSVIEEIQTLVGGGVVFLESEDHSELLDFYTREPNAFSPFWERVSDDDGIKYIQLMRFL